MGDQHVEVLLVLTVAARGRDRQVGAQRRVRDEEQARHQGHLDVEDLAGDDSPVRIDVEDCRQHGAQRAEQARREPNEPDRAVDAERAAALDDFVQNGRGGSGIPRRVWRKKLVDNLKDFGGRRLT